MALQLAYDEVDRRERMRRIRNSLVRGLEEFEHFNIRTVGGLWTLREKGTLCDAVEGQARTVEAQRFCDSFMLKRTSRFAIAVYGWQGAVVFAHEWCSIMNRFFEVQHNNFYEKEFSDEEWREGYFPTETFDCLCPLLRGRALHRSVELLTMCPKI